MSSRSASQGIPLVVCMKIQIHLTDWNKLNNLKTHANHSWITYIPFLLTSTAHILWIHQATIRQWLWFIMCTFQHSTLNLSHSATTVPCNSKICINHYFFELELCNRLVLHLNFGTVHCQFKGVPRGTC